MIPDLIVIPCSAQKGFMTAPAAKLYTSPHFQYTLNGALQLVDGDTERVRILSALHGLVQLERRLAPYDVTIGDHRAVSPVRVCQQLDSWVGPAGDRKAAIIGTLLPKRYDRLIQDAGLVYQQLHNAHEPWLVMTYYSGSRGIGEQRGRLAALLRENAKEQP